MGVLLYELLAGKTPFPDSDLLFVNIVRNQVKYPAYFSEEAKNLIGSFMQIDPAMRLGAEGFSDIKNHKFFCNLDWEKLLTKEISSPIESYSFNQAEESSPYKRLRTIKETPGFERLNLNLINFTFFNQSLAPK